MVRCAERSRGWRCCRGGGSAEASAVSAVRAAGHASATGADANRIFLASDGHPRAARSNLRGHARPTGDTHDWPLDEQRLGQFQDTLRIRKKVTAAAGLYKLLLLVALIFFVIFAITGLTALMEQKTNQRSTGVTVIVITVVLGICVFYYFAERGTRRSQAWAPMTMFILFLVGGAFQVLSLGLVARATTAAQSAGAGVGLIVALIFNVAFAVASLRAVMAMPKYLAQPAWCQELIAKAGL